MTFAGQRGACRTCCVDCAIASDDFNRADSSTVDGWTEIDGDWSIDGNTLLVPSSGFGVIRFDTPDPGTADGVKWKTNFLTQGFPGRLRWLVDYIDSNNYSFVELSISPDELCFGRREGGTETLSDPLPVGGITADTWHTLSVCWGVQSVNPLCGSGQVDWVWTLDLNGPGQDGWQPVTFSGDCGDPACGVIFPEVTGTEVEGQVTSTTCESILGDDGAPVFAISATLNNTYTITEAAVPLGGTYVGLQTLTTDPGVRFDNAVLTLLKDGCPTCRIPVDTTSCIGCITGTGPRFFLLEVEDVANDCFSHCTRLNRSYVLEFVSWTQGTGGAGNCCFWGYSELQIFNIGAPCADHPIQLIYGPPNVFICPDKIVAEHFVGNFGAGEGFWFCFDHEFEEPLDCSTFDRLELTPRLAADILSPRNPCHGPNVGHEDEYCDYTNMKMFLSSLPG